MKHILILLLGMLLLPVHMQAYDDLVPQEGLIGLWDMSAYPFKSMIGGKPLKYGDDGKYLNEYYLKGGREDKVYRTLIDGRTVQHMVSRVDLPYTLANMPRRLTILTYIYDWAEADSPDETPYIGERVLAPEKMDMPPFIGGEFNKLCGQLLVDSFKVDYAVPLHYTSEFNEARGMWERRRPLIFTVDSLRIENYNNDGGIEMHVKFNQHIYTGGEEYCMRRIMELYKMEIMPINSDTLSHDIKLEFFAPEFISRLAIYDRFLTEDELKAIMGVDEIKVHPYDEDYSKIPYLTILPCLYICCFLFRYFIGKRRVIPEITQQYIEKRAKKGKRLSLNRRAVALEQLEGIWWLFTGRDNPIFIYDDDVAEAKEKFDNAIKAGCTDADIIQELNEVARLINRCNEWVFNGTRCIALSMVLLFAAIAVPYSFGALEHVYTSRAFYIYFIAVAAIIAGSFVTRTSVYYGKPVSTQPTGIAAHFRSLLIPLLIIIVVILCMPLLIELFGLTLLLSLTMLFTTTYLVVNTNGAILGTVTVSGCLPAILCMMFLIAWFNKHWPDVIDFATYAMVVFAPLWAATPPHSNPHKEKRR